MGIGEILQAHKLCKMAGGLSIKLPGVKYAPMHYSSAPCYFSSTLLEVVPTKNMQTASQGGGMQMIWWLCRAVEYKQRSLADAHPSHTFPWQMSVAPPRDSRSHGVATTAAIPESCYFWVCFCGRRRKTSLEDVHPSHTVPWKT